MSPPPFASFVRTGWTWPVAWNRVPARKITAGFGSLSRKSAASKSNWRLGWRTRRKHEHDSTIGDDRAGTFRALRRALRPRNTHGAALRARASLRNRKNRSAVPDRIRRSAEEFCRAANATAIRFALDRASGWAAHLPEARRFAAHRRAQNQQRDRSGTPRREDGQAAHHRRNRRRSTWRRFR